MITTILLADDHAIVREGLRLMLEMQPHFKIVGEADNGIDAVRKVRMLAPDLAVIDISMPLLNGVEVTREIVDAGLKTNVIILSMHSDAHFITRSLAAGARGYVLKESVSKNLLDAIEVIQAGRRYLDPKLTDIFLDDYIRLIRTGEANQPLYQLSHREREVLQLVAEGHSSAEIAEILCLAPSTVDTYRSRVAQKLHVNTLSDLIRFALQEGLIQLN